MKDGMRARFQQWYADEVQTQLKQVSIEEVKISVIGSQVQPLSARWIAST